MLDLWIVVVQECHCLKTHEKMAKRERFVLSLCYASTWASMHGPQTYTILH